MTAGEVAGTFLELGDPRWDAALGALQHDVYHLPGYVASSAPVDGGRALAYHARLGDAQFLAPLVVRPLPPQLQAIGVGDTRGEDVTSPYGYGSPICNAEDPAVRTTLFKAFCGALREAGFVSAFLRLHPLLPPPAPDLASYGTIVEQGTTLYSDLSPPPEVMWKETRRNHRRDIKSLREAGYTTTMDDWSRFGEFIAVYLETMKRLDAAPYYHFGRAYFEDLKAKVAPAVHLCCVLSPAGDLAAGGLFFAEAGIVEAHLAGTAGAHVDVAPSTMLYDTVRSWAKQRGDRFLHYGMGLGGRQDSVYHFKLGFATHQTAFQTLRIVFDQGRYDALLAEWSRRSGQPAEPAGGFFPAYRKPLPPGGT